MCRLIAYAAPVETTAAALMGEHVADQFQSLARLHEHGWGTSWLDSAAHIGSSRTTKPGASDDQLHDALHTDTARTRLAHLRLASDGPERSLDASHPFVASELSFAHNGTIVPKTAIGPLLSDETLATLRPGAIDSEWYFALVRQNYAESGSLAEAAARTVREIRRVAPGAALNAIVQSATELVVVQAATPRMSPERWFTRRGIDLSTLPPDHTSRYYVLREKVFADGSVAFASTGLDDEGWSDVPHESVTSVDLTTLERTRIAIFEVAEAGSGTPVVSRAAHPKDRVAAQTALTR